MLEVGRFSSSSSIVGLTNITLLPPTGESVEFPGKLSQLAKKMNE